MERVWPVWSETVVWRWLLARGDQFHVEWTPLVFS
jgi:hypothetical protein